MKKILLALMILLGLSSPSILKAQDFSVADTVFYTVGSTGSFYDDITNNLNRPLTIVWHVDTTNFPSDWLDSAALGICDNSVCRANGGGVLWNGTSGTSYTSAPYAADTTGPFDYSPDLSAATTVGTFYLKVKLQDASYSKITTFVITKPPLGVPNVKNASNDIILYPNPANNELNVVYSANADVKNIAVYNIIGKVLTVYKVAGSSANLNIENIPSGIYFVRLYNSQGNVVVTRKFTKQ